MDFKEWAVSRHHHTEKLDHKSPSQLIVKNLSLVVVWCSINRDYMW